MLNHKAHAFGCAGRPRQITTGVRRRLTRPGILRSSNAKDTPISTTQPSAASPRPTPEAPTVYRSIASLSSVSSLSSIDEYTDATTSFRFLPSQLAVFRNLANSMQNCSLGLGALAFGSVVMNAFEVVEHAHHHHAEHAQHAVQAAAEAMAAAAEAVAGQAPEAAGRVAAALPGVVNQTSNITADGMSFFQEVLRAVSLTDVAFCINEVIPALLIVYAAAPFQQLAGNPDEPHMALALKGVGRLSVTLQQLAWTSSSVAVVLLLTAAAEYPPIVGVASWSCLALAMARGASLWWVISQHTTSGEEVARTLAALRGGAEGSNMNPLDRAASWLALGVLLQAEERLHADHHRHHPQPTHFQTHQTHEHPRGESYQNNKGQDAPHFNNSANNGAAASGGVAMVAAVTMAGAVAPPKPHYEFDLEEERVLRSLVEAASAAGLAISLLALATLALGLAEAGGESSNSWVSSIILASQKAANATVLFTSAAAFDRALHNDDGNEDTDHLLEGLGRSHSGMTGLFTSMAVLSLALILAGSVALLIPSLEESPVGVLLGDGLMHASADLLVEVLEAL